MRELLPQVHTFFAERSKSVAFYATLMLVALVGYLDYATGFEISLSFLYIIPIALVTWYVGGPAGYFVTFLSILTWLLSNWAAGQSYSHEVIRYWNALTRFLAYTLILLLLQEFKRALAHERMLSQTDHLTGVANNREFYSQVTGELTRASRIGCPISVVYLDLDGFKQVNDKLGHRAGDHVLRVAAQTFQGTVRKTDLVARLGGDEFAILLPNTDQEGARCIMGRVKQMFLEAMHQLPMGVTLSAGVISYASAPESVDDMLHEADAIMYRAKSAGKNDILYIQYAVG